MQQTRKKREVELAFSKQAVLQSGPSPALVRSRDLFSFHLKGKNWMWIPENPNENPNVNENESENESGKTRNFDLGTCYCHSYY
jgi:hypothetical protein